MRAGAAKRFDQPNRGRAAWIVIPALLLCPALLHGQGAARDALSTFPADTLQIVYSDLRQLRALPDYPRIRQWIFTQQLRNFEDFLRASGTDPEKVVDEVTLGWRGDPQNNNFFGLAEGTLDPDRMHDYADQQKITTQPYGGYELFPFNSNQSRADLFFVFLDSSSAAFGRLDDLKVLLDVRSGTRPPLSSVAEFTNAEAELEGTSPQWGIARGSAAANQAAPWLTGGVQSPVDPKAFLASVQYVLYRFDWASGFSMHMSVLCKDDKGASDLAKMLVFVRSVRPSTSTASAAASAALFQGMDIQAHESRVEVKASVPAEIADQLFRNSGTLPSP